MNLLAIDTSTSMATVALKVGAKLFSDEQDSPKTHAQYLLSMIDHLLLRAEIELKQLDGLVFGCGPGSFTGLRIACSIAKGLAYAHDLPLFPVGSLDAIAWSARREHEPQTPVLAVMDARMHELYWSYFPEGVCSVPAMVSKASQIQVPKDRPLLLAGTGFSAYWQDFPALIKSQVISNRELFPQASALIEFALHAAIEPLSAAEAQPIYVRNQVTQGGTHG